MNRFGRDARGFCNEILASLEKVVDRLCETVNHLAIGTGIRITGRNGIDHAWNGEWYSLLGSFSEYLRGNLFPKQSSTPTPVYEELDLVRAYLALENARYQDRIQCRIEEAYDEAAVLYPMLIEPLVENSVKHGLRRDEPSLPLHIDVIVRQENGMLDISVQDDGCGFDVTSFQHEDGVSCNHRSVGLSNLNARLRLHYGVSLSIESQIGQGTRIAFRIPAYAKERGGRP